LVDDTLNAALFLLIGLEIAPSSWSDRRFRDAVIIPIVRVFHWRSVTALLLPRHQHLSGRFGLVVALTLGELRGGISKAPAHALPWPVPGRAADDRLRGRAGAKPRVIGSRMLSPTPAAAEVD
jgi:NhaP-type Na+/H+ or K+/H+ antiporter